MSEAVCFVLRQWFTLSNRLGYVVQIGITPPFATWDF